MPRLLSSTIIRLAFYLTAFIAISFASPAACMEQTSMPFNVEMFYINSLQQKAETQTNSEEKKQLEEQLTMAKQALAIFAQEEKKGHDNHASTPLLTLDDYQLLNVIGNKNNDEAHFLHYQLSKHMPLMLSKTKLAYALGERKSIEQLKQQQACLQALLSDETLFSQIENSLTRLATLEKTILSLYQLSPFLLDPILSSMISFLQGSDASSGQNYIRNITQNKHSIALLDLFSTFFIDGNTLRVNMHNLSFNYQQMLEKGKKFTQTFKSLPILDRTAWQEAFTFLNRMVAACRQHSMKVSLTALPSLSLPSFSSLHDLSLGKFTPLLTTMFFTIPWEFTSILPYPTSLFISLGMIGLIMKKSLVDTTQTREQAIKIVETFAALYQELIKLQTTLATHPILSTLLNVTSLNPEQTVAKKIDLATNKAEKDKLINEQTILKTLIPALKNCSQSTTSSYRVVNFFKKIQTRFCSSGSVAQYHQLAEVKNHFIPALCTISELALYHGLVKVMKEHQNKNITFCFPQYEKNSTHPHFKITQGWLPQLLGHQNLGQPIISYDFELGKKNEERVALITGVNQGGKTSFFRTCATIILMATTLGFVPAHSCSLTLPSRMLFSFNPSDNLGQQALGEQIKGTSGFGSEVHTLHHCVEATKKLKQDEYAIVFADELFGKANGGGFFAAEVIKQIFMKQLNTLTLVSSLFEQPKLLADGKTCTSYQFTDHNSYKLQPGALIAKGFKPLTLDKVLNNKIYKPNLDYLVNLKLLKQEDCFTLTPAELRAEKIRKARKGLKYLMEEGEIQQWPLLLA